MAPPAVGGPASSSPAVHLLPGPQTTPGYFLHVKANTEVLSTVCDKRTSVTEKRKVEKCEGTRGPSQRGGQFVYFKQGVQVGPQ